MKWRQLVFLFMCSGICHIALSQYVSEDEMQMPEHRNAIGTYITTPVSFFMGASPYTARLGLSYKRYLKPNKRLRLQVIADFPEFDADNDSPSLGISSVTDTTISHYFQDKTEWLVNARVGHEWSRPEEKIAPVYGVDIIVGFLRSGLVQWNNTYMRNPSFPNGTQISSLLYSQLLQCYRTDYLLAGVAFSAGWRFNFKKHMELNIHFSPEFLYKAPIAEHSCTSTNAVEGAQPSLRVHLRVIELLLFYRF
ncbi:MAG: hypothetical protein SH856_12165 [Flavobacteriales bacterium]|nr:hypothetical protein [Flavobacteriales bacterium]